MKFKHLILAVAALACGSAIAQSYTGSYNYGQPPYSGGPFMPVPTLEPLRATFTLNADGSNALSASSSTLLAKTLDPANAAGNLFQWNSSTATGQFAVSNVTTQGDQLTSASSNLSSLLVKRSILLDDNVTVVQRELYWTNFSFDVVTGAISADWKLRVRQNIDSGPIGTPEITDFGRLAVFQATNVQGGQIVPGITPGGATTSALFSGLKLTTAGSNVFLTAMGLSTGINDPVANIARNGVWGSVAISAVPEPATYALTGMGLLVVGSVAARRRVG
jgi:hypothetical protein